MLNIQLFRTEKERILKGLKKKNFKEIELVEQIIALDEDRRKLQAESDTIASTINASSKNVGALMAQGKKEEAEKLKTEVASRKEQSKDYLHKIAAIENEVYESLVRLPNLPHSSVPIGKTPEENEVVRQHGETPDLSAQKLAHWDIAAKYSLIDFELGNKITGSGFPVYVDKGAKLQRALISYFLDYNTQAGYKEYYPPYMVNEVSAFGTGQLPDKEGQMYEATEDRLFLIPTAEVPVTNIYRDEIVKELPIKMTAYTPCIRREAGS